MSDTPTYSLYEAEKQGHAKFLWAVGDGSTIRLRLTMRSLRPYPIAVIIEPGTAFAPRDQAFQEMAVIRPTVVHLKPFETRSVWVSTACLQAERRAPARPTDEQIRRRRQKLRAKVATYLRQHGLETHIEEIIEEHNDGLRARLHDLERIGDALGYSRERVREIYDELEDMNNREPAAIRMGYALTTIPPERASQLRCITEAVEQIDADIAHSSRLARKPVAELIREYGLKNLILALAEKGDSLKALQARLYLSILEPGLANNVFQESGHHFKPGDGFQMVEFDEHDDPAWRSDPQLSSIATQYAIWAITDDYGLNQCCRRIKRKGRNAILMGAAVRSILHRAAQVTQKRGNAAQVLGRKNPLFAESAARRALARMRLALVRWWRK